MISRDRGSLIAIAAAAFSLRMVAGLLKGPEFVENGYGFYAEIAQTLWNGGGFCQAPGEECAVRMPIYPTLIAPFVSTGNAYPWLIVLQAMLGSGVVLAAALLGRLLFNRQVGLLAGAVAAVNPYAVVHGPSLQDTVVINFLSALAVVLLILSSRQHAVKLGVAAGVVLGLTVLTSARMLPFAVVALLWVAYNRWGSRGAVAAVAAPAMLLVALWCARNAYVLGTPVLTTEAGLSLWLGNHGTMLGVYPTRSIDEVQDVAWASLNPEAQRRLEALSSDPVGLDRAFGDLAIDSFRERPVEHGLAAAWKVGVSLGGWLSPARSWPVQLGYAAVYIPLNVLAVIGLWRARHGGSGHTLVLLVFAAFVVTTAVFWAHTSHRSYLHIFKIIYAASVVELWLGRRGLFPAMPARVIDASASQSAAS